jgi:hypothetical protein
VANYVHFGGYLVRGKKPVALVLRRAAQTIEAFETFMSGLYVGSSGGWYDPNDLLTVFQDRNGAASSIPAYDGDPVGTMLDKSGNGFHMIAPDDDARPTLRQVPQGTYLLNQYYLEPNGTGDWMSASGLNLAVDYTHVGAWRPPATDGRYLWSPSDTSDDGVQVTSSRLAIGADAPVSSTLATVDTVIGLEVNYGAAAVVGSPYGMLLTLTQGSALDTGAKRTSASWINGSADWGSATDAAQTATNILALFSRENDAWGLGFDGRFYGGMWIDRDLTDAERITIEEFLSWRTNVTLEAVPNEFLTFDDGQPLLAEDGEPLFAE